MDMRKHIAYIAGKPVDQLNEVEAKYFLIRAIDAADSIDSASELRDLKEEILDLIEKKERTEDGKA